MDQTLFQHLQHHIETTMAVGEDCADKISDAAEKITAALLAGRTIYSCGIEETTPLSQLFVNYLTSGYQIERPGFPAVDLETVTNNAKDDECYARSVHIHGQNNDVIMVFSTGGNASMLQNTIDSAVDQGMLVILVSASDDNLLADKLCNNDIEITTANYGSESTATVVFLIIQCLCKLIDNKIFGEN